MPSPPKRRPAGRAPARSYTQEELRDLGRRARDVGRRLEEATELMNESLCALEDAFLERLGPGARGRVELRRDTGSRPWVEFLVYKDGEIFVESNRHRARFEEVHILSAPRECRAAACGKAAELWEACGGPPLVRPEPSGTSEDT